MSRNVAALLRQCTVLTAGRHLHDSILRASSSSDPSLLLSNLIIHMYGNCGSVLDADAVFRGITRRNIFSWNVMMGVYITNGLGNTCLALFQSLYSDSVVAPDIVTFITALCACTDDSTSKHGLWLHAIVVIFGFECHVVIGTALVSMYGKCGSINHARWTFDNMPERNIFSWNSMASTYAQNGQVKDLIQLLQQMLLEGMIPDRVTCMSALSGCTCGGSLEEGKRLHASVIGSPYKRDIAFRNALLTMYGKCGTHEEASSVFHAMPERNLITWNAMIASFGQAWKTNEALEFFTRMQIEGVVPDGMTFSSIFPALVSECDSLDGKILHARVAGCGYDSDVIVRTSIITMYGNCGTVNNAWAVFNSMNKKTLPVWNAMITAYMQNGHLEAAVWLFYKMHAEGQVPDKVTFVSLLSVCADEAALIQGMYIHEHFVSSGLKLDLEIGNSLVNLYGKCRNLEDAVEVFYSMPERNLLSWSSLITSYAQQDLGKEALQLFDQMVVAGVLPDKVIFICVLPACATEAALEHGRRIHHCIVSSNFEADVTNTTALLNMYGKCGNVKDAQNIFDRIPFRNLVLWNSLIAAYAHHGQSAEAIICFDRLHSEGFSPDDCSFYSILSSCSHAGLLEKGNYYLLSMIQHYHVIPTVEHFNRIIDLFGRAGQLDIVETVIRSMPLQPSGTSWMTLLGACRLHLDRARGRDAATQVFGLDPANATPLVLLSNVCTASMIFRDYVHTDLEILPIEQLSVGVSAR